MLLRVIAAITLFMVLAPTARAAQWWKGTTKHFVIYSEGSREDTEQLAVKMERLDQVLRIVTSTGNRDETDSPSAKLTVYQFGDSDDIEMLIGAPGSGVAGFFIPRAGASVAFVPLRMANATVGPGISNRDWADPNEILFHEYTHYFMFQHSPAAYPAWYSEGLAEVFGTLRLTPDGFDLGAPSKDRAYALRTFDPDLTVFFDPPKLLDVNMIYAGGWLLTSYLSFEPSRAGQLRDYLNRLNKGEKSIDAARAAFGDLKKLGKEVSAYRTGRIRGLVARFPGYVPPSVELQQLSEAESAAIPVQLRSRRGVTAKQAPGLAARARKVLEQFPDDETVLLMAGEAEIDAQNLDAGEAHATRALTLDPRSVLGELLLARSSMERGRKESAQFARAREHYLLANRIDPDNAEALAGYYNTYLFANEAAPEGALIALERAFELAPFDDTIRLTLAYQLLTEKRGRETIAVLGPIINSPHQGKRRDKYRSIVAQIEAGQVDAAIPLLRPKMPDPNADDDSEEE